MPQDNILNKAKLELNLLVQADDNGNRLDDPIPFSSIERIRELFDDIEKLRQRKYKLSVILHSINNSGMNLSMVHFKTILSRIRKEKGFQLRNRTNNNKIKSVHNQNEIKQPTVADNGKLLDVTLSPLQRNDIDKSHYTPDDWANEWELIMAIYKSNKDLKWKYQVLGGNINDVEHLTDSLKDIRVISDKTSNLFRQQHNEYKIRSRKR